MLALRTPTLPPAAHTNVYLVGPDSGPWAAVDPGSPYPDQQVVLDRAIETAGVSARRRAAHASPRRSRRWRGGARGASAAFRSRRTSTRRAGCRSSAISQTLEHGERVADLECVFTPGHADGHLCFAQRRLHDRRRHGRGARYDPHRSERRRHGAVPRARSKSSSRDRRAMLLPAHGPAIPDGHAKLREYIAHRMMREGKVAAALGETRCVGRRARRARLRRYAPRAVAARGALAPCTSREALRRRARARGGARAMVGEVIHGYSGCPPWHLTFDTLAEVALARDLLRRWWGLELGLARARTATATTARSHVDVRDADEGAERRCAPDRCAKPRRSPRKRRARSCIAATPASRSWRPPVRGGDGKVAGIAYSSGGRFGVPVDDVAATIATETGVSAEAAGDGGGARRSSTTRARADLRSRRMRRPRRASARNPRSFRRPRGRIRSTRSSAMRPRCARS